MRATYLILMAASIIAWLMLTASNAFTLLELVQFRSIRPSDYIFIGVPILGLLTTCLGAYFLRSASSIANIAWLALSLVVAGFFLIVVNASRMG